MAIPGLLLVTVPFAFYIFFHMPYKLTYCLQHPFTGRLVAIPGITRYFLDVPIRIQVLVNAGLLTALFVPAALPIDAGLKKILNITLASIALLYTSSFFLSVLVPIFLIRAGWNPP
jgi:hypothetical protein